MLGDLFYFVGAILISGGLVFIGQKFLRFGNSANRYDSPFRKK